MSEHIGEAYRGLSRERMVAAVQGLGAEERRVLLAGVERWAGRFGQHPLRQVVRGEALYTPPGNPAPTGDRAWMLTGLPGEGGVAERARAITEATGLLVYRARHGWALAATEAGEPLVHHLLPLLVLLTPPLGTASRRFTARVALAGRWIAAGRETGRNFDSCFEENDGDAVVLALHRQAARRPDGALARNLDRYLCPVTRAGIVARAPSQKEMPLVVWAAQLRGD